MMKHVWNSNDIVPASGATPTDWSSAAPLLTIYCVTSPDTSALCLTPPILIFSSGFIDKILKVSTFLSI